MEDKPKTIADLGKHAEGPKPVVGQSMLTERKALQERIRILEEKRRAENMVLEAAGYDYGGNEQWYQAMRNVGRR